MLTDWMLIRRLAAELERSLAGERILSAGLLADGRSALQTRAGTLAIDIAAATPYVSLESVGAPTAGPGWPRALDETLTGLRIRAIMARLGDRLLVIECSAQSRFGVASAFRLVAELVPRFGNLLILKERTVVAAAREFPAGAPGRRTILQGLDYEPPPLPEAAGTVAEVTHALGGLGQGRASAAETRELARALHGAVPLLPRLLAESLAFEAAEELASPADAAGLLLEKANGLVSEAQAAQRMSQAVFAYRDEQGALVQAHIFPLRQLAALREEREPELLPLLAAAFGSVRASQGTASHAARRAALSARIEKRRAALASERTLLESQRDGLDDRDALRTAGDLLYAHLAEVPAGARLFVPPDAPARRIELDPALSAKANAQAFFRRYKKAVTRAERAVAGLRRLESAAETLDALAWEAERADPETIDEIAEEFARLDRKRASRAAREKPRKALEFALEGGARIWVGRSPRNNAELTFRIARPDDLWFHARATPGAHVILHFDDAREAQVGELIAAAQLAAYHSKARSSEKVAVDYTARKHVRRRPGAAPGLVWYDDAQTIVVTPKDGAGS